MNHIFPDITDSTEVRFVREQINFTFLLHSRRWKFHISWRGREFHGKFYFD